MKKLIVVIQTADDCFELDYRDSAIYSIPDRENLHSIASATCTVIMNSIAGNAASNPLYTYENDTEIFFSVNVSGCLSKLYLYMRRYAPPGFCLALYEGVKNYLAGAKWTFTKPLLTYQNPAFAQGYK